MDDLKKMVRAVINGQGAHKQELLAEIKKTREEIHEVDEKVDKLRKDINAGFKKVDERLNMQGKQLAELDDDVPAGEDFFKLEKRVEKIEKTVLAS